MVSSQSNIELVYYLTGFELSCNLSLSSEALSYILVLTRSQKLLVELLKTALEELAFLGCILCS